jgi:putative serine protease PepD
MANDTPGPGTTPTEPQSSRTERDEPAPAAPDEAVGAAVDDRPDLGGDRSGPAPDEDDGERQADVAHGSDSTAEDDGPRDERPSTATPPVDRPDHDVASGAGSDDPDASGAPEGVERRPDATPGGAEHGATSEDSGQLGSPPNAQGYGWGVPPVSSYPGPDPNGPDPNAAGPNGGAAPYGDPYRTDSYRTAQFAAGPYGAPYPPGPYAPNPYGPNPYGPNPYGAGPYPGGPPGSATSAVGPGAPRSKGRGIATVAVVALATALLGGGVGGAVGYSLAGGNQGSPGVLGQPLPGPDEAGAPLGPVESVAARVLPSVVQLRVEGGGNSGEGSGMVLSPDGLLLTNNHVVEAAAKGGTVTAVFQDGATAAADIVGRDPSSDLAVLRARNMNGLTPIELGNSDSVRVGQQVVAFGSPLGLGGTVTTGIISALDRPVSVGGDQGASESTVLNALQTDAAINPGNSGGPLVDMQGKLIGINSAIATTGSAGGSIGVGFSIPVNQAKRVAEELERTGKASRAQLGVSVGDDPKLAGARIQGVEPGSAAEAAGLKAGDLVLRFGDQRILAGEGLQAAVRSRAPGEVVEIQLSDRTVSATLGTAP